jgi:tetratricopeptide (TPR) repeat protein
MNVNLLMRHYLAMAIESVKKDRELQLYLVIGFLALIVGGGYYGYRWYAIGRAEKAQQAYAASLEVYQQAFATQFMAPQATGDQHSLWEQVEVDARHALEQYGHSSYAPFFTAFLAQSLFYQGKRDEALATMRTAVMGMRNDTGYRGLYHMTYDLMLLDGTIAQQKVALEDLEKIADDATSGVQDMALYYLGVYYGITGDHARSVDYLKRAQQLPVVHPELPAAQSPWQKRAAMKLSELGADE